MSNHHHFGPFSEHQLRTQSMQDLLHARHLNSVASSIGDSSDHESSTLVDEDSELDEDLSHGIVLNSTAYHPVTVVSASELQVPPKSSEETKVETTYQPQYHGNVDTRDTVEVEKLEANRLSSVQPVVAAAPGGAATPRRAPVDRTTWIDGLRGVASLIIFTHHFGDNTFAEQHPETLPWGSPMSFLRNGQLAVALFFLLSGRVLTFGFLRGRNSGVVRWRSLASAIFRRTIRLALPILVLALMQQQVCLHGATDVAAEVKPFLQSYINKPYWCQIESSGDFISFFIRVLSSPNHKEILDHGSSLWSMYDQFWGSVYVYILSTFMVMMTRRRYYVYFFIAVFLVFVSSPNLLFVLGLLLSDLAASNITKRVLQSQPFYVVMAIQMSFLVLAFTLIIWSSFANALDNFFAKHTLLAVEGTVGVQLKDMWPQVMRFSYWVTAFSLLVYVELSHAAQYFFSSRIFVFLGKVTFGTYVLQMTVIYSIMPRIILHLQSEGWSYWNNIIFTYVACLAITIALGWVFYHTVDKGALNLARWMWNELFEKGTTRIGELPLKAGKGAVTLVRKSPRRFTGWVRRRVLGFVAGCRKFNWFIHNWRTPIVRDRTAMSPADLAVRPQDLRSTFWTADLSQDKEAMRTAWLLRLNSFLFPVHFVGIPALAALWFFYNPIGPWSWDVLTFGSLWRILWCLSVPYCIITYVGFCTPRIAHRKITMDKRPVKRDLLRNFYILIVTQGSNEEAVRRGYNRMKPLERLHPSVRVVVLTDAPYSYPDLDNVVCPADYKSPKGIAKHKARALDYFRHSQGLSRYDWILHMDEESTIDGESLRRCFDFIRYTDHDFGQGVIIYNAYKYWHNWFFSVADGIRVGDDLARFNFQFTTVKRPVFGVHGSFLMTSGEVENENTWDFGTLAEDFEFSQAAWQKGFSCGAIHGIVREQSPGNLRDFMKQRRRWYMGIRDIEGMYYLPQMAIKLWTIGIFCLVATIINIPFSFIVDGSPSPLWIVVLSNFCFANFYWLYLWGVLFQELDFGTKWYMVPIHFIASIFIQPFASIAEGCAVMWALASENTGKFEVIKK
ncbi:hypothetical protein PhCBS80983_g06229 [Powellomyces hirtus]|uniref:Acyltransferase 3 domain-containing protein n=1 Tax=Powellomyces hirtus TaxID=109895 RepID=A0A507DPU4_9FUNG|nr:hypothetical protein PhCBS80983_g06229 [Powellomyces hirtus]